MKFKSRKDTFFTIIIYTLFVVLVGILLINIGNGEIGKGGISVFLIILAEIILFAWIYYGTNYELSEDFLRYKSGPFRGKIAINSIKKILKGKTLWVGMKPATARKGLIIKYNKFDEIYISPQTNDLFIEKILQLNSEIEIITE